MLALRPLLFFSLIVVSVAVPTDIDDMEVVMKDEKAVLVRAKRYANCYATWSCEDCNTRVFCLQFSWNTFFTYYQCPESAPYCITSNNIVTCNLNGTVGCIPPTV